MATRPNPNISVVIRDRGLRMAIAACTRPATLDIEAGLLEETSQIAEYGFYNEFGVPSRNIPARSFIRSAFDENRGDYARILDAAINDALLHGKSLRGGFIKLGARMVRDIKKKITKLRIPPNRPATIARKKSSNPLIDDGVMRNSIRWREIK